MLKHGWRNRKSMKLLDCELANLHSTLDISDRPFTQKNGEDVNKFKHETANKVISCPPSIGELDAELDNIQ